MIPNEENKVYLASDLTCAMTNQVRDQLEDECWARMRDYFLAPFFRVSSGKREVLGRAVECNFDEQG